MNPKKRGGLKGRWWEILSRIKINVTFHHINCKATDVIDAECPKLICPIEILIL